MKNNVKHLIWSSWINEDNWRDDIKEECELNGVEYDEDGLYYMAYELNNRYLEDERVNLDIDIPNGIIAIADLGLWFERRTGYKEIGNNIADCLDYDTDDAEFWVDSHGVFHAAMYDHDGVSYVVYKAWKDGVTEEQKTMCGVLCILANVRIECCAVILEILAAILRRFTAGMLAREKERRRNNGDNKQGDH